MRLFLLLLFFTQLAFAVEDKTPMLVHLATEDDLIPIYLEKFVNENSGFDNGYPEQLKKILAFDLNHNGMTYLEDNRDQAAYHVLVRMKERRVEARVIPVFNGTGKELEGVYLSGYLSEDRRQIHRLADMIHKALFGTGGIASTRILYTRRTKDTSEIWESDYDGANARQVTHNGGYCITPTYIPPKPGYRSGSFFYVSYKTGQPKIYMASLRNGLGRRLSQLGGNQLMPSISKQRDQVAFIGDVTGNPDIFLQPFNPEKGAIGKPRQIYASHLATQGTPSFSPDGTQIAFVSNKDGSPRIYVIEIPPLGARMKDIKPILITKYNRESTAPCWSPDGSKIAYCSRTKGVRQIWVYDLIKREERQLTQGPVNKENPSWASNSLHLVYNSTDSNNSELYLIYLKQPKPVKISSGPGEKRFPCWENFSFP